MYLATNVPSGACESLVVIVVVAAVTISRSTQLNGGRRRSPDQLPATTPNMTLQSPMSSAVVN